MATAAPDLRERILADFAALQIPVDAGQLDAVLARASREGLSHQQFLHLLLAEQADRRRERSIARRIREARFRDNQPLGAFDWEFNRGAIDRVQIEELASGAFVQRRDNLVLVGQSGVGKSHLIQGIGQSLCALGYTVRYTTSAGLLEDLTASLADQTLPRRVRYYARFELLVIDEFGFDRIERKQSPQAANLLFKIIDARSRQRSTAVVTNIDFEAWSEYLGDPPLATAFLDRVVDGAIILKIKGKSYRAHRANPARATAKPAS
ncbi:MAG: IS21-like element helper ATPase IstB [Gemmataceae bacterium]|nr:IS21-like element helper ATPase IstB [Gemmataceae bacterium]